MLPYQPQPQLLDAVTPDSIAQAPSRRRSRHESRPAASIGFFCSSDNTLAIAGGKVTGSVAYPGIVRSGNTALGLMPTVAVHTASEVALICEAHHRATSESDNAQVMCLRDLATRSLWIARAASMGRLPRSQEHERSSLSDWTGTPRLSRRRDLSERE